MVTFLNNKDSQSSPANKCTGKILEMTRNKQFFKTFYKFWHLVVGFQIRIAFMKKKSSCAMTLESTYNPVPFAILNLSFTLSQRVTLLQMMMMMTVLTVWLT